VDGTPYAVKLTGADATAGLTVAFSLARGGVAGVPAPVLARDGRLWSRRDGRQLSLVPWVSDQRAYRGPMTAEHWRSYGALLAAVHAYPAASLAATVRAFDDTQAVSVVRSLNTRLAGPVAGDRLIQELAEVWRGATAAIDQLVLAVARLAPGASGSVLCHADPHLHNLLLGPAGTVWLVDWDDAVLATPELDLMFVLVGVLDVPVSVQQQEWFFSGYGPVEIDPARLAYYRCVRALEELDFAQQVLHPALSIDQRSWALGILRGVLSLAGIVPLALASVRELEPAPGDSGSSHVGRAR
jgi:spectinomycin phosphotransferase